ncbi:MAG: mannose-phosphate guanylyltransferase [Gammaproteobacteria bacterium]|jgi:MurNAc alpha-1-phosphate uridylyltransferase|nr:mannose-phosphate guanylyltransferase [Gammaproteobacteria bacterium]
MKAMLLAAGFGRRLSALTKTQPKPLLKVQDNTALIDYHLFHLAKAGVRYCVINVSHLGHLIQAHVGDGTRYGLEVVYSVEDTPLETGGGIKKALPLLGADPFIVISADIWCNYPLQQLSAPSKLAHLVLNDRLPATLGDFSLQGDLVSTYGCNKLNYAGISVLRPELFDAMLETTFPLIEVWRPACTQGLVSGEYYSGLWFNVGDMKTLKQIQRYPLC